MIHLLATDKKPDILRVDFRGIEAGPPSLVHVFQYIAHTQDRAELRGPCQYVRGSPDFLVGDLIQENARIRMASAPHREFSGCDSVRMNLGVKLTEPLHDLLSGF